MMKYLSPSLVLLLFVFSCKSKADKPAAETKEGVVNAEAADPTAMYPEKEKLIGTWVSAEQFDKQEMSQAAGGESADYAITAYVNDTTKYEAGGQFKSKGNMKMDLELKKEGLFAPLSLHYVASGSWELRQDTLFTIIQQSEIQAGDAMTQKLFDASPGMKENLAKTTGEQNTSLVQMLAANKMRCADVKTNLNTVSTRLE